MGFVLALHILVCILLVITILMQAGRGGGLAESFASAESMFGTQTNSFLVRASTILAAMFLCTSLVLAVYGAKGDKSLMQRNKAAIPAAVPVKKEESPVTVKIDEPKPIQDVTNTVVNAAQ